MGGTNTHEVGVLAEIWVRFLVYFANTHHPLCSDPTQAIVPKPDPIIAKTPADLDAEVTRRIQELSVQVYQDLNCRGMARVDFINHNGVPHIVEVNTVPGFSEMSIIPQQARQVGMEPTELISLLLEEALNRFQ